MTAPPARPDPAGPDLVDRSAEAAKLAAAIVAAESRLVVLHGKAGSGKTELIKHWLIPTFRDKGLVAWYGACDQGVPDLLDGPDGPGRLTDALTTDSIIVLDGFTRVLDLPGEERRGPLADLFGRLQGQGACVVLVVDTRQLTGVYALGASEPGLAPVVLELGSVSMAQGLLGLSARGPGKGVRYRPEVLLALSEDARRLEEQGPGATPDLVALLDAQFRRLTGRLGGRAIDLDHYRRVLGGIGGILRSHLEERLAAMEHDRPGEAEIGRALLEWVVAGNGSPGGAGVGEIAPRLGVEPGDLEAVLARLIEPVGILRVTASGSYELVPPQLAGVLAEDAARREEVEGRRARALVDAGLGGWQLLANLPSRERFAEIHGARIHLALQPEEVHFLLLCALRYGDGALAGAPRYWLGRLGGGAARTDVLLAALSDQDAGVRLRAASLLRQFPAPHVGQRLLATALTDAEPAVRAQAVASLEAMPDAELVAHVIREARNPKSAYQAQAVRALGAFPRQEPVAVLQSLVNERETGLELRAQAVAVLGTMNVAPAVDALIDIALKDEDQEDRDAAAKALAVTRSEELNRQILNALRAPDVRVRIWLAGAVLVAAAGLGVGVAFQLMDSLNDREVAVWILAGLPLVVLTGIPLRRMRDGRVARRSPRGVLGMILFALSTVGSFIWFHGAAHALVGRWKRAGLLLGIEVLAIALAWVTSTMQFLPGFDRLVPFYGVLAIALFLGSYGWDVVATLFHGVVFTETTRLRRRRAAVAHEVLGNPVAAGLVFSSLASQDGDERRLARRVLRRFGGEVSPDLLIGRLQAGERRGLPLVVRALQRVKKDDPGTTPRLEALWRGADSTLRPLIVRILSGRPDQRSLDALGRLGTEMGAAGKLNAALAQVRFKLAVLPVYVWAIVVLAAPPAAVLGLQGWNVLNNPGWSQVLMLARPPRFTGRAEEAEQITAATILKDHYATGPYAAGIADALLSLLKNGTHRTQPAVQAAVVSTLVAFYDGFTVDSARLAAIRDRLVTEAGDFRGWLAVSSRWYQPGHEDSLATGGPVGALRDMAAARDPALADSAIQALRGFVRAPGDSGRAEAWKHAAIRALGTIPYDRAVPALDTLDRALSCAPGRAGLCEKIRSQMDSVIGNVVNWLFAALRNGDCAPDAPRLLSIMDQIQYRPAQVDTAKMVAARLTTDRNGDGVCDRADRALQLIDASPNTEDGYLNLREYYVDQELYRDAASAMQTLKDKYRGSLWPRKILANIYHEYLPQEDTTFFRRSYEEMADLRRLPAFLALAHGSDAWVRIESDYAEIALSARRYRELETSAGAVLAATSDDVYRFNLPLFLYLAQVIRGDPDSAAAALDSLQSVVRSLPAGFYNAWIYLGTEEFIRRSHLPAEMEGALLGLCREGFWPEGAEMDSVLAANRSALRALPRRDR